MKSLFALVIFVLSHPARAESFAISINGKVQRIEVQKYKEIHLSKSCFSGKNAEPSCDAYSVLAKKIKANRTVAMQMNPAAFFCEQVGGLSRTMKNNVNMEFDYCEFADKSLIDAWDLYLHFQSKKQS